MPVLEYLVIQLPQILVNAVVAAILVFLANRAHQKRSHANATLGKWHDRRIEKLETISRTAWKLDRKARKLFHYSKEGSVAEFDGTVEEIRDLQNELEILTQFYAPLLIEFRIKTEKAMDVLEGHVAILCGATQNAATVHETAKALASAIDHLRHLRNAAMCDAQEYLNPSDSRRYVEKTAEVHKREEHYATTALHSDET